MRPKLVAALFAVLLFLPAPGSAKTKATVSMPDHVQVAGRRLALNGMGVREATVFKVDVYVAGLYLEKRSSNPKAIIDSAQAKRLDLKFVRDVDRDDLVGAFKDAFRKNRASKDARDGLRQLTKWMSSVSAGDSLTLTFVPDSGTEVLTNGKVAGKIPGAEFASALWQVWLGDNPPNAGLKTGLLGRD